jgi:hypothetical protein
MINLLLFIIKLVLIVLVFPIVLVFIKVIQVGDRFLSVSNGRNLLVSIIDILLIKRRIKAIILIVATITSINSGEERIWVQSFKFQMKYLN